MQIIKDKFEIVWRSLESFEDETNLDFYYLLNTGDKVRVSNVFC